MFTLKFDTDNAEFDYGCAEACARVLRREAKRIIERAQDGSYEGTIFDISGNSIGEWEMDVQPEKLDKRRKPA